MPLGLNVVRGFKIPDSQPFFLWNGVIDVTKFECISCLKVGRRMSQSKH